MKKSGQINVRFAVGFALIGLGLYLISLNNNHSNIIAGIICIALGMGVLAGYSFKND